MPDDPKYQNDIAQRHKILFDLLRSGDISANRIYQEESSPQETVIFSTVPRVDTPPHLTAENNIQDGIEIFRRAAVASLMAR